MDSALGIDYGSKKVGFATGSIKLGIAFAKKVVLNKGFDFLLREMNNIFADHRIGLIVLGHPLQASQEYAENPITWDIMAFQGFLAVRLKIPIILADETFSSFEAEKLLNDLNKTKRAQKNLKDALAAQIILQRYFDSRC